MTSGVWESFRHWCETNDSDLINQWMGERNLPNTPDNVGISSKIKFWWRGPCGHEWDATFGSRLTNGSGCPICSNRRVLAGYNDLQTTNPEIAAEWHPIRNGELKPTDVIEGSNRKVWWICNKGHEYEASLCDRHAGNGCPYCAGKRPILGETDLASQCPRLVKEWHPTKNNGKTPQDFTKGSNKKVWWICEKGHEWQAVIHSRVDGNNCPYCGNQLLLPGYNDLATVHPDWAKQWHPTKNGNVRPDMIFGSAGKKYWWICENGHEWDSSPNNRSKVPGCPICSGHRYAKGFTDLATVDPQLAAEWHPTKNGDLTPDKVHFGTARSVWWQCSKGHEWKVSIATRYNDRTSCPYCSGKMAAKGETDLATVNPSLAAEWHPTKNGSLTPADVLPHTMTKVWWKCKKGHEWQATVNDRSSQRGCPFCYSGSQASFNEKAIYVCLTKTFPKLEIIPNYEGFRKEGIYDLDIFFPEIKLAIEYDGPRHNNPHREKVKNDHCSKKGITLLRIKEHLRNIDESLFPEPFVWISDHAPPKEIDEVTARLEAIIAEKAGIQDYKSHAHLTRYRSQINELVVIVPEKSLAETYPEVAKQWHPTKNGSLTPDEVYASSNRYAWWMCEKGHEWEAVIGSRSKNGCPFCSNRRIIPGENDFASAYPLLAKQWHPTKNGTLGPDQIAPGTSTRYWWICDKGHEWLASPSARAHGRGCAVCAGKKIVPGCNDLATKYPAMAKQWHPTKNGLLKACEVAPSSNKKYWWMCEKGHEWEATPGSRSRGLGCPYCSGRRAIPGVTDLATMRPDLIKEWHPTKNGNIDPSELTPDSHVEIWWMCEKGHEWKKIPHGRGKCPYCTNHEICVGFNDLASKYPEIATQFDSAANNLSPTEVLFTSDKEYWWKCENGHKWKSTISNRVKSGGICIECSFIPKSKSK